MYHITLVRSFWPGLFFGVAIGTDEIIGGEFSWVIG